MTGIDWAIVAFTVLLAVYGYAQGFIVGALSLVGFAAGAFIGTRIAPLLLSQGSRSPYAPLFGLLGALVAGGIMASGLTGLGARLRRALRFPGVHTLDGLLGAGLTACVALGVAWILGSVALQSSTSPKLRTDIQHSAILSELDSVLPPSGAILNALARIDPLPLVRGPVATVSPPNRRILAEPTVRGVRRSVVRVFGTACGLGVEGSGWVAAPGLVVTNAHVVAGETDTQVEATGVGTGLSTTVLEFDVHDDLAVLRVAGLTAAPLPMAGTAKPGTAVAILGYPLDGPFDAEPGRIGQTQTVSTQNAYGVGQVLRSIVALRGLVRPGNSGGPLIDRLGRVEATTFAAITGTPNSGGFAVPNPVVRVQLARAEGRSSGVGTGHCGT